MIDLSVWILTGWPLKFTLRMIFCCHHQTESCLKFTLAQMQQFMAYLDWSLAENSKMIPYVQLICVVRTLMFSKGTDNYFIWNWETSTSQIWTCVHFMTKIMLTCIWLWNITIQTTTMRKNLQMSILKKLIKIQNRFSI